MVGKAYNKLTPELYLLSAPLLEEEQRDFHLDPYLNTSMYRIQNTNHPQFLSEHVHEFYRLHKYLLSTQDATARHHEMAYSAPLLLGIDGSQYATKLQLFEKVVP